MSYTRELDGLALLTDERFAEQLNRIMNLPALIEEVSDEVAKRSTAEVLERFAEYDFAAGAVASRRTVHEDQTIVHLGLVSEQDAPGVGRVRQPAPMWTFSDAATVTTTSLGFTGADSRHVLAGIGIADDELDQLLDDGVVVITDGTQPA